MSVPKCHSQRRPDMMLWLANSEFHDHLVTLSATAEAYQNGVRMGEGGPPGKVVCRAAKQQTKRAIVSALQELAFYSEKQC